MKSLNYINWLSPTQALKYLEAKFGESLPPEYIWQFIKECRIPISLKLQRVPIEEYYASKQNCYIGTISGEFIFETGSFFGLPPSTNSLDSESAQVVLEIIKNIESDSEFFDWITLPHRVSLPSGQELVIKSNTATIPYRKKYFKAIPEFGDTNPHRVLERTRGSFTNAWLSPECGSSWSHALEFLVQGNCLTYGMISRAWLLERRQESLEDDHKTLREEELFSALRVLGTDQLDFDDYNYLDNNALIVIEISKLLLDNALNGKSSTQATVSTAKKESYLRTIHNLCETILERKIDSHFADATAVHAAVMEAETTFEMIKDDTLGRYLSQSKKL